MKERFGKARFHACYYFYPKSIERKQSMENVVQKNEKLISEAIKVNEKKVMEH